MPVIEQKTTNKNKVDFDLNRLDKSKTTIFSKYPFFLLLPHSGMECDGQHGTQVFSCFHYSLLSIWYAKYRRKKERKLFTRANKECRTNEANWTNP